jgi:hypothetical protein
VRWLVVLMQTMQIRMKQLRLRMRADNSQGKRGNFSPDANLSTVVLRSVGTDNVKKEE